MARVMVGRKVKSGFRSQTEVSHDPPPRPLWFTYCGLMMVVTVVVVISIPGRTVKSEE
jgi:hypothetical protein